MIRLLPMAAVIAAMVGCGTPPPAPKPPPVSDQFRFQSGWVTAPADAVPRGEAWWTRFDDAELDRLMREAGEANGTVEQALARVRQAEAQWRLAGAADKPVLKATAGAERARADGVTATVWQGSLLASWQPDLWGRVALERQASRADLRASEADVASVRLAVRLELARAYLRLRVLDRQRELSEQTLSAYERSLTLTRNQYEAGLVARSDVTQAEVQAQSVRAGLHDLALQRALYEHTIAVLAGRAPVTGTLAPVAALPEVPAVPAAVPSTLLVHRPDVAVARERLEAASARAGSARRAWLPDITISAAAGVRSSRWSDLFEAPARVWSVGPQLAATLFDAGARQATADAADAATDEQAAAWRLSVLTAMKEVDDALAGLQALDAKATDQARLVALAEENERVVTNRYRSGLVSFLEVAVAQNLTLQSRRAALDVTAERLDASLRLMAALGGGWEG